MHGCQASTNHATRRKVGVPRWEGRTRRVTEAALTRELAQELNITLHGATFLARGSGTFDDKLIQLDVYATDLQQGNPVPREHQETPWLGADELSTLDWAEADIPVVPAIQRYMRSAAERTA